MNEMPFRNQISKEELNSLPLFDYPGKIELIETLPAALKAIEELKNEKLLGFDTETRPSFSKGEYHPVTLLQLANDHHCYLFRLNKIGFIPELTQLLENEAITKVGVAVRDDVIGLQKLSDFMPAGFIDIAVLISPSKSEKLGLRALVGIYLGKRLTKGSKVTNWERSTLTEQQIAYAANDAFASYLIYEIMMQNPKHFEKQS